MVCADEGNAKIQTLEDEPSKGGVPTWPAGTFDFKDLHGMDCQYKNDGSNAGALWCGGRDGPISCQADNMRWDKDMKHCEENGPQRYHQALVYCEW